MSKETNDNLLHGGHRARMREELKLLGASNMYDHKLLEIFLYAFVPRKDTNMLAHNLIDTFGSLKNVIYADWRDLENVKGMTETAALNISLLPEFIRRSNFEFELVMDKIDNFSQAANICRAELSNKNKEEVLLICLDASGKVVRKRILSQGGLNEVYVNSRSVSEEAFRFKAHKVILAHNHPSGIADASQNDRIFTSNLALALAFLDIILIDHIIVANRQVYSLKNEGLINSALRDHLKQLPSKIVADITKENNQW